MIDLGSISRLKKAITTFITTICSWSNLYQPNQWLTTPLCTMTQRPWQLDIDCVYSYKHEVLDAYIDPESLKGQAVGVEIAMAVWMAKVTTLDNLSWQCFHCLQYSRIRLFHRSQMQCNDIWRETWSVDHVDIWSTKMTHDRNYIKLRVDANKYAFRQFTLCNYKMYKYNLERKALTVQLWKRLRFRQ